MIIGSQPLLPCRFNEGRRGLTAAAEVRGRGEAARVSDVDLEVRCRDAKPTGAHIRPVWKTRDFLLRVCREAEPLELGTEGVPHTVVAVGPQSRIPRARVSVIAFRVIPAALPLKLRTVRRGPPQPCTWGTVLL